MIWLFLSLTTKAFTKSIKYKKSFIPSKSMCLIDNAKLNSNPSINNSNFKPHCNCRPMLLRSRHFEFIESASANIGGDYCTIRFNYMHFVLVHRCNFADVWCVSLSVHFIPTSHMSSRLYIPKRITRLDWKTVGLFKSVYIW